MLEFVFKSILVSSAVGTLLFIIFDIVKPLTRKVFSPSWHYYMYLLILVVMLSPIRIAVSDDSVINKIHLSQELLNENNEYINDVLYITGPFQGEDSEMEGDVALDNNESVRNTLMNILRAVSVVWILTSVSLFLVALVRYMIFVRYTISNSYEISLQEIKEYTNRKVKVRVCRQIFSPFVMGIFKPVLILPEKELTNEQIRNILSHEMTHLRRFDMLVKWFSILVKSIHFFNPFVYYLCRQLDNECEISCDAIVVKSMTRAEEINYINTILSLIPSDKKPSLVFSSAMSGNKDFLKKRFLYIKNKRKVSKKAVLISIVVAVALFSAAIVGIGMINGKFEIANASTNNEGNSDMPFNGLSKKYIGYIEDAKTDFIKVYTEKDGEYVMSIPWEVVEYFPANNRNDENFKFGWMDMMAIYCGEIGDFRWAVVATSGVMNASNANVCTSTDGGKNWYVDNSGYMSKGIVDGAWFVSETEGYISYSGGGYGRGISKTVDGGRTWEHKMEYDMPLPLSPEDAVMLLKYQLMTAYEIRYGEYIPRFDDPGSLSGDKERLPFIIETLRITKDDGEYYTVPVIWDFLIEKETGRIYKFYDGIDKMQIPFDPLDENALSFAG